MKISKTILHFFGYFSIKEIEAEIEFAQFQIETIKEEDKNYKELVKKGKVSAEIYADFQHNRNLLSYYKKELEKWNKKLRKRKK